MPSSGTDPSILQALLAPGGDMWDVDRKTDQLDHLLATLEPKVLILDEFHNALRGCGRDVEAVFAFLRWVRRQNDISPMLISEVAVCDFIKAISEMASYAIQDTPDGVQHVDPISLPPFRRSPRISALGPSRKLYSSQAKDHSVADRFPTL